NMSAVSLSYNSVRIWSIRVRSASRLYARRLRRSRQVGINIFGKGRPAIQPESLFGGAPQDDFCLAEHSAGALADGKGGKRKVLRAAGSQCRLGQRPLHLDRQIAVRDVNERAGRSKLGKLGRV